MKLILKIFWISLVVKLVIAALVPLTGDEAYYWVWSQHLQLSYYDHPPFVAWLYGLGSPFKFFPGSVRWPGVLLAHATLYLWLKILEPHLNIEQRRMWLWLALLSPLVGGSAIVVTPDLPLMFFYAVSILLFAKWQTDPNWRMSIGFGLAMGLGFSSKYMMVLFGLSILPVVLLNKKLRPKFFRQVPWLLLGVLAGSVPVWLWNFYHDFASIKFQAAHGLGRKAWKSSWTIEYVLLQIGVVFPVVFYWALRSGRRMPRLMHFLAWTPLVFFFFTTFRGYVEANWPIAAYPAIFALAVSWYPVNRRGLKFTAGFWGLAFTVLLVIILGKPSWSKSMKFKEFHQFDGVKEAVRNLDPVYARSYQMAAKLSFDLDRPIYKLHGMNRKDFFDFLEESEPKPNSVYYVAVEKNDSLPLQYRTAGHRELEKIPVDDTYEIRKVEAP